MTHHLAPYLRARRSKDEHCSPLPLVHPDPLHVWLPTTPVTRLGTEPDLRSEATLRCQGSSQEGHCRAWDVPWEGRSACAIRDGEWREPTVKKRTNGWLVGWCIRSIHPPICRFCWFGAFVLMGFPNVAPLLFHTFS